MLRIAEEDFGRDVRRFEEWALAGPVMVTRKEGEGLVLLSATAFRRLAERRREVLDAEDFSDAGLAAILASEPPTAAQEFDHEYPA